MNVVDKSSIGRDSEEDLDGGFKAKAYELGELLLQQLANFSGLLGSLDAQQVNRGRVWCSHFVRSGESAPMSKGPGEVRGELHVQPWLPQLQMKVAGVDLQF
ncbi:hypothetical protein BHE74_00003442 [Ensete ventricosum]|nr:hypothetical protein BHE74_00003442 [Ensete ventricosum]